MNPIKMGVVIACGVLMLPPVLSPAGSTVAPDLVSSGETGHGLVVLHTMSGVERFRCELASRPGSLTPPAVWEMVPDELRASLHERVERERDMLEVPAGIPMLQGYNLTFNFLCSVTGVGLLLMVPPFVPVTPLLFSTLTLLSTNGTLGEWVRFSVFSVLSPFVGISLYVPNGLFVYTGYAGVAVAVTE